MLFWLKWSCLYPFPTIFMPTLLFFLKCFNHYLVCICAADLCIWSCLLVCIHIITSTKSRLFSVLPLENLLLSAFYYMYFLTEVKHLQCGLLCPASCTDRAIHSFPNKTEYYLLSFNGTPHPLCYQCFSSCLYMYVCLCDTTQARQHMQCRMPATAVQYSESASSVCTGYVFGTLAFNKFVSLTGFQHHKMYSHYLCKYVYLPTHVLLSQVFSLNISWLLILHTNHTICINNEFVILLNSILHILCFEHIVAIAYVLYFIRWWETEPERILVSYEELETKGNEGKVCNSALTQIVHVLTVTHEVLYLHIHFLLLFFTYTNIYLAAHLVLACLQLPTLHCGIPVTCMHFC